MALFPREPLKDLVQELDQRIIGIDRPLSSSDAALVSQALLWIAQVKHRPGRNEQTARRELRDHTANIDRIIRELPPASQ